MTLYLPSSFHALPEPGLQVLQFLIIPERRHSILHWRHREGSRSERKSSFQTGRQILLWQGYFYYYYSKANSIKLRFIFSVILLFLYYLAQIKVKYVTVCLCWIHIAIEPSVAFNNTTAYIPIHFDD